jgi:hypothetical protein
LDDDTALIIATAHDYFDGWFDGDVSRMERALHRDLVKRSSLTDQASTLSFVTAQQMTTWTGEGEGEEVASGLADRTIEVEVLDVKHDIASVLVRSEPYYVPSPSPHPRRLEDREYALVYALKVRPAFIRTCRCRYAIASGSCRCLVALTA